MKRRGMLTALLCSPALLVGKQGNVIKQGAADSTVKCNCGHEWRKGKLWALTSKSPEEPEFYPPQGLTQLEMCTQCGTLRVPADLLDSLTAA